MFRAHRRLARARLAFVKRLAGDGADLQHGKGRGGLAAIGESGIGGGQFQRRHHRRAQRQRRHRVQLRSYAQALCRRGHGARTDFLGELRRHRVGGSRKGPQQRHFAFIAVLIIAGRPFAERHRLVPHHVLQRVAMFQRRQIDEGLESAARLAHRVGGAVEAGQAIGAATHHGANGAIRRHRHQRGLGDIELAAVGGQALKHGGLRQALGLKVETGLDHDGFGARPDQAVQLRHHPIREIARAWRTGGAHDARAGLRRRQPCFEIEIACFLHRLQHHQRAFMRGVGIGERVVARGRLDDARQDCRLGESKLGGMLAEEFLRCRFQAIQAGAEIDLVEIQAQDLILGVAGLQIDGERRFLKFSLIGAAGREEQILGQLLRQGRAALHHAARRHVAHGGARQAEGIDAEMAAEAAILDGDEGVHDIVGQVGNRHGLALGQTAPRDQAAMIVEQGDILRRGGRHQIAHIGQAGNEMREDHRAEDQAPDREHDDDIGPAALAAGNRLRRGRIVIERRGRAATAGRFARRLSSGFFGWRLPHRRNVRGRWLMSVKHLINPHPSQLGSAKRQTPRCDTFPPFLVLRTEGGRKLSDAAGRPAAPLPGSRYLEIRRKACSRLLP